MKYLPGCLEITISFLFKPVKKLQNYEKNLSFDKQYEEYEEYEEYVVTPDQPR